MFASLFSPRHSAPAAASSGDIFARAFGHMRTNAGVVVNHGNAITIPAVSCAVGTIADGLSMMPADVRRRRSSGRGSDAVPDHPVSRLLNREANPFMSAFTARNTMAYHQVLWGNGYMEIERDGAGRPVGLWPMLPDRTAPEKTGRGMDMDIFYRTSINGESVVVSKENTLHVPALSFDGYVGVSPISVARQAMGLALATEEFGAKFFANDAKSGGVLMHPGKLSDAAKDNLAESVNKKSGLENAHRIKILEEGMKFVQTTIPPEDAQFLGTREFQIAEIARIFRVPLFLLQSNEKSTTWGSGIEQQLLAYLSLTLTPWIIRVEQEINRKMFSEAEIAAGYFLKLNINALMRSDMSARSAFYQSGISSGWLTRNEVREKEDQNPLPGLDEPLVPLNMIPDDEIPETEEPDEI